MKPAPIPENEILRQAAVSEAELFRGRSDPMLDGIVEIASVVADAPMAAFSVIEGPVQWHKAAKALSLDVMTQRSDAICGHTIFHDHWFEVPDTTRDPRFAANALLQELGVRFYAGMPVHAGPARLPVGTLNVMDVRPRELTPEQREALQRLAALIEERLSMQKAIAQDPLTGLYNRRMLDRRYLEEWRGAVRGQEWLAVVLIDIDHFKSYNDHLGHQAGDACLREVAQCIGSAVRRPPDVVARYGGEEFMVVLPDTNREGARLVAERMRMAVEGCGLVHPETNGPVTVSIGLAAIRPLRGMDASMLVQRADVALYEAKMKGRNQVVVSALNGIE